MSIQINKKDLEIEYFKRGKGHGGQALNKTYSSVRIKHLPSGIVVEASEARSQFDNRKLAMEKLQTRLAESAGNIASQKAQEVYDNKPSAAFSSQIRTYRMCGNAQGVTDHRTGVTHGNTKQVLDGEIDKFLLLKKETNG